MTAIRSTVGTSQPFVSRIGRFEGGGQDPVPGPGAYDRPDPWAAAASSSSTVTARGGTSAFTSGVHHNHSSSKAHSNPASLGTTVASSTRPPRETGNVKWERVASIPSIPAGAHRFGFDEAPNGELIPQPPPAAASSLVGPAVPPDSFVSKHRNAPASTFARSRATREVWGSDKPLHKLPGPGEYSPFDQGAMGAAFAPANNNNNHNNLQDGLGLPASMTAPVPVASTARYLRCKPNAVFASRNAKMPRATVNPVPGPGSYPLAAGSSFARAAEPAPVLKQCFGARAARSLAHIDAATAAAAATPGPGAYDANAKAAFPGGLEVDMGGLVPSAALPSAPSAHGSGGVSRATAGANGVFRSATSRFTGHGAMVALPAAPAPGPGAYSVSGNIGRAMALKSFSRNQTFGSTSSRFPTGPAPQGANPRDTAVSHPALAGLDGVDEAVPRAAGGGLGPNAVITVARNGTARPSAAFSSKSSRMGAGWEYDASCASGAGEGTPATASTGPVHRAPPVGAYDVDIEGRKRAELAQGRNGGNNAHFLSRERRFHTDTEVKNALLESHLGPGTYDVARAVPSAHRAVQAPVGSVFKSSQPRFVEPSLLPAGAVAALAAAAGPGPGQYGGPAVGSMVKRSYNVTIDTPRPM